MSNAAHGSIAESLGQDLKEFQEVVQAQDMRNMDISFILDLVRSDKKPLIGGDTPNDPGLVTVRGQQSLKQVFEKFAALQGGDVTLTVANLADYTQAPHVLLEGAAAHEFALSR